MPARPQRAKGATISTKAAMPPDDRATAAYRQLRALILANRLPPGMPIVETRAAVRFGVTRITLRAALQRLEQEGYVAAVSLGRYRRRVVSPLTIADMDELFDLVGALEGVVARRAAGLPKPQRERLAADLNRRNLEMFAAVTRRTPDPERAGAADTEFHRLLLACSGRSRAVKHLEAIQPQIGRYRAMYYDRLVAGMRIGYREHAAVVRAIASGAGDRAEAALEAHWRNSGDRLRPVVEAMGEHGNPVTDTARARRGVR